MLRFVKRHLGLVHTTPGEGFTLKTHQMFSVHTTPKEFENATVIGHFGFVFEQNSVMPSFPKRFRFKNVFRLHENEKPAFSNSSGLKSVLEELRFRDGLMWTVGLNVEIKFGFQTPSA